MNLVRYMEWMMEWLAKDGQATVGKQVLNFTAQSFYLQVKLELGKHLDIYGRTRNGMLVVKVDGATANDKASEIIMKINEEMNERNDFLSRVRKLERV